MDDETRIALTKFGNAKLTEVVAELLLTIEFPDGHKESQQIKIGRPVSVGGFDACPVESIGPIHALSPCIGDNSFQALTTAIASVRVAIHGFVKKSACKLYYGDDCITLDDLNNVLFASGICDPETVMRANSPNTAS